MERQKCLKILVKKLILFYSQIDLQAGIYFFFYHKLLLIQAIEHFIYFFKLKTQNFSIFHSYRNSSAPTSLSSNSVDTSVDDNCQTMNELLTKLNLLHLEQQFSDEQIDLETLVKLINVLFVTYHLILILIFRPQNMLVSLYL